MLWHLAVNDKKQMAVSGFMLLATDRCTEGVSLVNLWTMVTETGVGSGGPMRFQSSKHSKFDLWKSGKFQ
jgi:hypothetical protein